MCDAFSAPAEVKTLQGESGTERKILARSETFPSATFTVPRPSPPRVSASSTVVNAHADVRRCPSSLAATLSSLPVRFVPAAATRAGD